MKNFKSICILIVAMASLLIVTRVQAQDYSKLKDATPEQRAQMQTGMMKTRLNLDTQQVVKVQAINLKYAQKFQPIIKSTDSRFTKLRALMALQKQKDKELQNVFTADQFTKYQDFEQEMKSKIKNKGN